MGGFEVKDIKLPKTWDELVALSDKLGTYGGATRLSEDQEYYDLFSSIIPRQTSLELINKLCEPSGIALARNLFPYSRILQYLPTVGHYLLWSTKGIIPQNVIKDKVEERFSGKRWVYFLTAEENKSVPEIWHAHILVDQSS